MVVDAPRVSPMVVAPRGSPIVVDQPRGSPMVVETLEAGGLPEGIYGDVLGEIAKVRPKVVIGSYPSFADGKFRKINIDCGKGMNVQARKGYYAIAGDDDKD